MDLSGAAQSRGRGRPRKDIPVEKTQQVLKARLHYTQIGRIMKCSPQTVLKHIKSATDSFRHHLPQDQLLNVIDDYCHLQSTGRRDGDRIVQSALFGRAGVRATQADVRSALRAHDPQANEARRERIIPRRTYDITEGMVLWHMDSYEKLKMYGFLVHGCIDGGSNFCVYATLALNKRGSTLRDAFDKAVDEYGYPLRMRAGMCFEATFVGQRMLDERSEGSIITGPSTANQRLEKFWNYIWSHFASYFKGLFQNMERAGILDRHCPADLFSLVTAFNDLLQTRLHEKCLDRNNHPIRPQASQGITTYYPIQRFMPAVFRLQSMSAQEIRHLQKSIPGGQLLDTGNDGSAANDRADRGEHAPCVKSPLTEMELPVAHAVYRKLADGRGEVQKYIVHREITKQMLKARPLHGGTTLEWAQFISEVDAMQQQIRQHILDEIETRRRLCLITCTINLLSQFSSLSHVPEGLELVG